MADLILFPTPSFTTLQVLQCLIVAQQRLALVLERLLMELARQVKLLFLGLVKVGV
jgi:hypothetical protein